MQLRVLSSAAAIVVAAVLVGCDAGPAITQPPEAAYVSATGLAFVQPNVAAPANEAFQIYFENLEAVPHNVNILDDAGVSVAQGEVFTGPSARTLDVPSLAAGQYRLICDVHPETMRSILVAGAT